MFPTAQGASLLNLFIQQPHFPGIPSSCCCRVRPQDTPDIARDDWFNLFVLHQNRVAHGVVSATYGHVGGD